MKLHKTHHIVYKNKKAYSSFPLLEHIDDNNIYIGFFKAPIVDHFGLYEWITMKSEDQGKTWEECQDKRSKFTWSARGMDPRAISDRYVWGRNAFGSVGFWKWNGKIKIAPCINMQTSHGSGFVCPAGVKGIITFPRPLHINNLIYIPAYGVLRNGKDKCFIFRVQPKPDAPFAWDLINMFPDNINANEMALIETQPGTILALIRDDNEQFMLESWSENHGLSWTYPVLSDIKGGPPHLLKLKDDSILCSYGYRFDPMGIRASLSSDGKKWEGIINLRDDGGYPSSLHKRGFLGRRLVKTGWSDVGYPVSIQLGDGSILTAYYITTNDEITHIAVTKWEVK